MSRSMDIRSELSKFESASLHNFLGDEISYWRINKKTCDSLVNNFSGARLNEAERLDNKETFKLNNGFIIHKYFREEGLSYHLFKDETDYRKFFDKDRASGISLDYETASKFAYVYTLKPKTVKEVFSENRDKKLLGTFTKKYYLVYEIEPYKGVFMLADNGHFNSAMWYPNFEACKIINEFDYEQDSDH